MIETSEVYSLIGKAEGPTLEYKAVLPPSRNIAQVIAAFANADGGYLILGVSDNLEILGLSEDFRANEITHKALALLVPSPSVDYQYLLHNGKKLFVIKIEKSGNPISIEGKIYKRIGASITLLNPVELRFKTNGYKRITDINKQIESYATTATNAKIRLLEHYQSILKIFDDLGHMLYPESTVIATTNQEGKILSRILFTSFVDNFETYLSDLLYEIFLANPATLKSIEKTVSMEEILNCTDIQEFIKYYAKKKLSTLQKGSVKGFIKENKQIKDLAVLDDIEQSEIEKILQIRHLYSHRNGIVDDKFLQYFTGQFVVNSEHQMSIEQTCDKLLYLAEITNKVDASAMSKYKLSQISQ